MTDETREKFDETLNQALVDLNAMDLADPQRKVKLEEMRELNKMINETDQVNLSAFDMQEKRRIDEEKNKSLSEIEEKKIKHGWVKVVIEGAIAVGLTVFEVCAHRRDLQDVTKYEETGRYNSTAFRMMRKPRIRK